MELMTIEPVLDEGRAVWFLDTLTLVKAAREQTGGAFGLCEQWAPAGSTTPYHLHRNEDESFYVLEGKVTFVTEDRRIEGRPGSFVFLPRGVPHGLRVGGTSSARYLVLTTPGGFEDFVVEMGEPAVQRVLPPAVPPDMAKLMALAAKYGIEILGPLPE